MEVAAPAWSILCAAVALGAVIAAVAVILFVTTRRPGSVPSREIAELRDELAELRQEIERLKRSRSTEIK